MSIVIVLRFSLVITLPNLNDVE